MEVQTLRHAVVFAETTHLQIYLIGANAEAAHSKQLLGTFQCAAPELHLTPDAQHMDVLYPLIQLFRRQCSRRSVLKRRSIY